MRLHSLADVKFFDNKHNFSGRHTFSFPIYKNQYSDIYFEIIEITQLLNPYHVLLWISFI